MFYGIFKVVKESVKCVSRKFHKKFQGCFKNLSIKFCFAIFFSSQLPEQKEGLFVIGPSALPQSSVRMISGHWAVSVLCLETVRMVCGQCLYSDSVWKISEWFKDSVSRVAGFTSPTVPSNLNFYADTS